MNLKLGDAPTLFSLRRKQKFEPFHTKMNMSMVKVCLFTAHCLCLNEAIATLACEQL